MVDIITISVIAVHWWRFITARKKLVPAFYSRARSDHPPKQIILRNFFNKRMFEIALIVTPQVHLRDQIVFIGAL